MSSPSRVVLVFAIALAVRAGGAVAEPPPTAPPAAPSAPPPGASAIAEPLPADPAFVTGTLDNGLAYIVCRHANPPRRARIWMHVHTGSLNETERQRGIAHYLEHMAFNGSANFAPGAVVPFFQSLGMTFGRDQNAFTNLEQTTFQLALPDAKPATLSQGMTFFADVLHRLLLSPKEIDAERQIIQEERRRGLSGRRRAGDFVRSRIAPGSRYGVRETIGTEASIDAVVEKDFHDYYERWYAASNATLLVVADAPTADVIRIVADRFGDAPKRPRPVPEPSGVVAYAKSFAVVASDPNVTSEEVAIRRLEPARAPTTTVAQFRDDLVLGLAAAALNRRLEDKIGAGGTSYVSARLSSGDQARTLHSWELSGRAAPGRWKAALEELSLELQRARTFGFTEREIDDRRRDLVTGAELAVSTNPVAQTLITRMNGHVTDGETLLAPRDRLALLQRLLPTITGDEITKRFAREFDPGAVAFVAVLPAGPLVPTEAALLEIGEKALSVKPTKDVEVAHPTQLIAKLPEPGEVKESDDHAGTRVWSAWLANNVRVHHKYMHLTKREVTVTISLVGGDLSETAENRGITSAASLAFSRPATKSLSSSDVRELLVGKNVSVRGAGGGGGGGRRGRGGGGGGGGGGGPIVPLTISGSPEDLETGFQLAYLLMTEPRIEPAAFVQFQDTTREALLEAAKNPTSLGARLAGSVAYPDADVRMQPLTPAQVDRLTLEASQAWLERLVKTSPIEVAIVGDLPKERAIELVTRYLGSLSPRERVGPEVLRRERTLERPKGPRLVERTLDTPTAQAYVYSGFYGADESSLADVRALTLAARVLSTRMTAEVREQAQLVYSINAGFRAGSMFPGFGVFSAAAPTEPHKTQALVAKLAAMYAAFAESGPTDAEVEIAKKQLANSYAEQTKQPGWWTARLEHATLRGTKLDDVAGEPAAYQAVAGKQIHEAFAKYWSPKNALVVVVKPAATEPAPRQSGPDGETEPGR
jgi:zinc protease